MAVLRIKAATRPAGLQISPAVNLGAAYEFLWAGDMSVDQGSESGLRGRVSGAFEDAWFSFFTLNLDWKF